MSPSTKVFHGSLGGQNVRRGAPNKAASLMAQAINNQMLLDAKIDAFCENKALPFNLHNLPMSHVPKQAVSGSFPRGIKDHQEAGLQFLASNKEQDFSGLVTERAPPAEPRFSTRKLPWITYGKTASTSEEDLGYVLKKSNMLTPDIPQ
ncbi:hypothetical protein QFC24_005189 [Naganishia onofrii]|uniref:Uncharacterized protein n=1 Tax=Naganishia onofrii TaxID=1851511 RepID=A0ACC2XA66_9TREE|nr:hypothetical protein QFC24_005189 [Naganishia onofrii]